MQSVARKDLPALTGLRFIAAMYVVFLHFGAQHVMTAPAFVVNIATSGFVSVSLFFVLSGFILTYSYIGNASRPIDRRSFWIARFARIYPIYAVAAVLALPFFLTQAMRDYSPVGGIAETVAASVLAFTMTQAWTVRWVPLVNVPGWSLSVEIFFYLLFPFLAVWLFRLKTSHMAVLVGFLWAAALGVVGAYAYVDPQGASTLPCQCPLDQTVWLPALLNNPLLRLPEFLMGLLAGRVFLESEASPGRGARAIRRLWTTSWLPALWLAVIVVALAFNPLVPYPLVHNGLLTPVFGLLVLSLAGNGGIVGRVLSVPFAVLLGEASYSLYILQVPAWKWAHTLAGMATGRPEIWTEPGFFLLYVPALIVASIACLYVVERPMRRLMRHWLSRLFVAPVAATSSVFHATQASAAAAVNRA